MEESCKRSYMLFINPIRRTKMKLTLIAAAAITMAACGGPALAQAVISDPGYCAQFYPHANCQNLGAGNPYTDGGYWRHDNWRGANAMVSNRGWHEGHRHHTAE